MGAWRTGSHSMLENAGMDGVVHAAAVLEHGVLAVLRMLGDLETDPAHLSETDARSVKKGQIEGNVFVLAVFVERTFLVESH